MGFLGSIFKGIIGGVTGFVSGGPAGAVIGAATGLVSKGSAASVGGGVTSSSALPRVTLGGTFRQLVPGTITGVPQIVRQGSGLSMSAPGTGQTSLPSSAGSSAMAAGPQNTCERGFHPKKHKTGFFGQQICVKNRHMNVGNTKALRRALRRAYGFEKLAMRTIRLIHPRKAARFGGFKKTRSRSR